MARELLLSMLSLLLVGTLHVVCGAGVGRFWALPPLSRVTSARTAELQAWRLLWAPLVPGALVLAFLLGWALQEPEHAEALHAWAYLCAAPILLVWGRAVQRAWRASGGGLAPVQHRCDQVLLPAQQVEQHRADVQRHQRAVSYTHLTLPTNREV